MFYPVLLSASLGSIHVSLLQKLVNFLKWGPIWIGHIICASVNSSGEVNPCEDSSGEDSSGEVNPCYAALERYVIPELDEGQMLRTSLSQPCKRYLF